MLTVGGKFPVSSLSEQEVILHREKEKQDMCDVLDEYIRICAKARVNSFLSQVLFRIWDCVTCNSILSSSCNCRFSICSHLFR